MMDLQRFALDTYCLASGAWVSFHKYHGMLVGIDETCIWEQGVGTNWLQPRQFCKYLGFQVGVNISCEQLFWVDALVHL